MRENIDIHTFVYSGLLLLVVSSITVSLSKKLGLGSILGLLATGLIVGPYTPGPLLTSEVDTIRHFTELGVVFLLFLIGLEIKPRHLWDMRVNLFGLGGSQIILSSLALAAFLYFMDFNLSASLVVGASLALSSTAFVVQILRERNKMNSPHGKAAFAILLMQDIAVVPLLSLLPLLSNETAQSSSTEMMKHTLLASGMIAAVIITGKYAIPKVLDLLTRSDNREGFFLVALASMFGSAVAMDLAGLSMGLGAFLMGMMLSTTKYSYQIEISIEPHKGLLMSLFFVAVGMSIDPTVIMNNPITFMILVIGILFINTIVLFGLTLLFGNSKSESIKTAFLLCQGGEFGFVVFGAAKASHVIDSNTFALSVALISVSMVMTPIMSKLGYYLANKFKDEIKDEDVNKLSDSDHHNVEAVIVGYGRVGHTIGTIFNNQKINYLAFDSDINLVKKWEKEAHPVYYGDVSTPDILLNGILNQVQLLVITIDNFEKSLKISKLIKEKYPNITICARAKDLKMCDELAKAGVAVSIPETLEASLSLASASLKVLGIDENHTDNIVQTVREGEGNKSTRFSEIE